MKQTGFIVALALLLVLAAADDWLVKVGWSGTFKYDPESLQIKPGDTVVFSWPPTGAQIHTVTAGDTTRCAPSGQFDSLGKIRGNFTHTFSSVGTFGYYCAPHCSVGMFGTVIVSGQPGETTPPPSTAPPTPAPTALPKSFLALEINFTACPTSQEVETYLTALAEGAGLNRSAIIIVNDLECVGSTVKSPLVITTVKSGTFTLDTTELPALEFLVDNGQAAPPPGQGVPSGQLVQFQAGAASLSVSVLAVAVIAALSVLYHA